MCSFKVSLERHSHKVEKIFVMQTIIIFLCKGQEARLILTRIIYQRCGKIPTLMA